MLDLNEDNTQDNTLINNSVWSNELSYHKENRPKKTLDEVFEAKMKQRASKFHGKPIDRTQYDKELLEKQLDLETVTITLHEEFNNVKQVYNDKEFQSALKAYKRSTTREPNEEGKYRRLIKEIEDLAQ